MFLIGKWACNPINLHLYWIHRTGIVGEKLREIGSLPGVYQSRERDLTVSCQSDGNLMSTMLDQAVAHIRAGEIEKARRLLIEVLKQNPTDENAWLWMSRCVTEVEQKRYCFAKVLKLNPQNQYAIRSLSYLNRPVSPPAPPKVGQQEPVQPIQKQGWGAALLNIALFAIGIFLVLLFLYAWWLAR